MYQKDFILRMIEMLGELVAGILGLIRKGEFPKASQALENAYYEYLKEDASFFRRIPKEKLTEALIGEHNYTNGHLEILAELFNTEAELLYAKGNQHESIEFYEKALLLFEFIEKESETYSAEKKVKMSFIKNRIEELKATALL
jgi:tetratricopeptide (TPR) repeat protein